MTNIDKLISESRCTFMTQEEEVRLFTIYINKLDDWEEARDSIVESCLLYVVKCAHGYSSDWNQIEDLVGEGIIGLLASVDRFELDQGTRFLTFASFNIKGRMVKFLSKNSFSRAFLIPPNVSYKILNVKDFIQKTQSETGEPPDEQTIAKHFDFDEQTLALYLNLINLQTFSLNSQPDDENKNPKEFIDSEGYTPYLSLEKQDTAEMLRVIISNLPERQRIIINNRFGFIDGEVKKLCRIGEELALTKQRVSQLEGEALEAIRKEIKKIQLKSNLALYSL